MDWSTVLAVLGAGFGAGVVMTAVGAGSLVSFPVLVGIGLSPLVANVCNNVGLVPGGFSGVFGFRRELAGHRHLVLRVAATSAVGALLGGVLLIALPPGIFDQVVPFLVMGSATLVGLGPAISAAVRRHAHHRGVVIATDRERMGPRLSGLSSLIGVYGGYFGAAQGVMLIAVLALGLDVGLHTVNGLKNVAVVSANLAATVVFVCFAPVDWTVTALVAVGSLVGGWLGAHLGRRLHPTVFRVLVVLIGYVVGIRLLLG
jgi:uncharacterized protein